MWRIYLVLCCDFFFPRMALLLGKFQYVTLKQKIILIVMQFVGGNERLEQMATTCIVTNCSFFKRGMQELLNCKPDINFIYLSSVDDIQNFLVTGERVILAVELATSDTLRNFWSAVDFLAGYNGVKVGVVITKYNAYLMRYLSKKIKGVVFFYAHELRNFVTTVYRWCRGYSCQTMRMVCRCNDSHGLTLDELTILTLPLMGESICEVASTINMSISNVYRIRNKALFKLGFDSYHKFCRAFANGEIRLEYERLVEIRGTLLIAK